MKEVNCLRCEKAMTFTGNEKLQLGQTGWILGDLPNIVAGALDVDIYTCPECGKIEFFLSEENENVLPQVKCPNCGKTHDFDYPKCPFCNN